MSYVSTRVLVVVAALAAGCALGDSGPDGAMTGQGWTPGAEDGGTETDSPADDPADDNGDAPADGATGASCEFGCNEPPGDCFEPSGSCENDSCVYSPVLAGEPCTDDCAGGGFCDASGGCICASDDMGDTGGTGDTGGNPDDCMMTCTAGAHASAACNAMGDCVVTCESPWEDCDGDPTNGCEVPVGLPHQCDAGGLNPNGGCWTAYCGSASGAGIADFGTYHCVDCPTCEQPSAGQCHWCNHDTGNWYPQEACSCGAQYLDAVCSP